jgi:uncharacterized membrane protein
MATNMAQDVDQGDVPGVERLLTLSDGVVAIALTLLVLQLHVPAVSELHDPTSPSELASQLGNGMDQFTSYLISFYVIGEFWLVHHRAFRYISGHIEGLAWWNFAFLITITLMPFTSNLLGEFSNNPLAIDIFAINLILASLATQATQLFARRHGLVSPEMTDQVVRAGRRRALVVVAAVSVSIAVAWINTDAAKYCWFLIAVAPWASHHLSKRANVPANLAA